MQAQPRIESSATSNKLMAMKCNDCITYARKLSVAVYNSVHDNALPSRRGSPAMPRAPGIPAVEGQSPIASALIEYHTHSFTWGLPLPLRVVELELAFCFALRALNCVFMLLHLLLHCLGVGSFGSLGCSCQICLAMFIYSYGPKECPFAPLISLTASTRSGTMLFGQSKVGTNLLRSGTSSSGRSSNIRSKMYFLPCGSPCNCATAAAGESMVVEAGYWKRHINFSGIRGQGGPDLAQAAQPPLHGTQMYRLLFCTVSKALQAVSKALQAVGSSSSTDFTFDDLAPSHCWQW